MFKTIENAELSGPLGLGTDQIVLDRATGVLYYRALNGTLTRMLSARRLAAVLVQQTGTAYSIVSVLSNTITQNVRVVSLTHAIGTGANAGKRELTLTIPGLNVVGGAESALGSVHLVNAGPVTEGSLSVTEEILVWTRAADPTATVQFVLTVTVL